MEVHDGMLTLRGSKEESKEDNKENSKGTYSVREFHRKSFSATSVCLFPGKNGVDGFAAKVFLSNAGKGTSVTNFHSKIILN